MILLALETSCDETSAAIVRDSRVLSNCVASQIALHAEYGGVVPELATREHLRNLIPVTHRALQAAGVAIDQIDAVAATQGPGLPSALMVGLKAGQALAYQPAQTVSRASTITKRISIPPGFQAIRRLAILLIFNPRSP